LFDENYDSHFFFEARRGVRTFELRRRDHMRVSAPRRRRADANDVASMA